MSRQNVQKNPRYTWALEISEVEVENGNQFCKKKYYRLLSVSCRVGDLSLSFSCHVVEYFLSVSFCLRVDFRSVVCRWVVAQRNRLL